MLQTIFISNNTFGNTRFGSKSYMSHRTNLFIHYNLSRMPYSHGCLLRSYISQSEEDAIESEPPAIAWSNLGTGGISGSHIPSRNCTTSTIVGRSNSLSWIHQHATLQTLSTSSMFTSPCKFASTRLKTSPWRSVTPPVLITCN